MDKFTFDPTNFTRTNKSNPKNDMSFKSKVRKMTIARAMGIMGCELKDLSTEKDPSIDPKEVIDKALWKQMEEMSNKKMKAEKEKVKVDLKKKPTMTKGKEPKQKPPPASDYNPYFASQQAEYGTIKAQAVTKSDSTQPSISGERKYAEDVMALHEAYQFLMRRFVIAPQAKTKLKHATGALKAVNMVFGGPKKQEPADNENDREEGHVGDEPEPPVVVPNEDQEQEGAVEIDCGACRMIEKLETITLEE